MLDEWKQKRARGRIESGNGTALQRFRWWQLPGRALFYLGIPGREVRYAVDIRHWQNQSSGDVRANLYRDGEHVAASTLPAAFPVMGGTIEVAMSGIGVKRCHYVTDDGRELQLDPDPSSAEGRRARLDNNHPVASRLIGVVSVAALLVGVVLLFCQIAEPVSQIPPIADSVGTFTPPFELPLSLEIGLGTAAIVGSLERALRLRYHWLLDAAGS